LVVEILPHGHHDVVGEEAGCLLLCQLDEVFNLKQNMHLATLLLTVLPTLGRTFLPALPEQYSRVKRKGCALINYTAWEQFGCGSVKKNRIIFLIFLVQ
jgi:hypothetical protein